MNQSDVKQAVLRSLSELAPEADLSKLLPDVNLREQLDLDSMDFLNFVISLSQALHLNIPELDYPKLNTLQGCIQYLSSK